MPLNSPINTVLEDSLDNPSVSIQWGAGFTGEMAGGIIMGGNAITKLNLHHTMSGGIVTGGSSPNPHPALSHIMTGGVHVRGTYDVSGTFTSIGASMGGEAGVRASYRTTMSGGIAMSGRSTAISGFVRTASGGAVVGGKADVQINYHTTMKGGVVLGGHAVVTDAFHHTMSGGVNLGGHSIVRANYRNTAKGGITMGGSATNTHPALSYIMKGGVTTGGRATLAFGTTYTMNGGIRILGSARIRANYHHTMSGGITMGGACRVLWGSACVMKGGITMGGKSSQRVGYEYKPSFPHNRIFIYGGAKVERSAYTHIMSGGINLGGAVKTNFCSNTCDTSIPFYRDKDGNAGCRIVDNMGKVKFTCARLRYISPVDNGRIVRKGAYVPAATICLERYFANQTNEQDCSTLIHRKDS
jgi:hypothetical protein